MVTVKAEERTIARLIDVLTHKETEGKEVFISLDELRRYNEKQTVPYDIKCVVLDKEPA